MLLGLCASMHTASGTSSSRHDVYGFEDVALPPLPSGARLVLGESRPKVPGSSSSAVAGESHDTMMWSKLREYVALHERDDAGACGVGGEVWPAASALCEWLGNHSAEVCGSRILELGSGTGACGLYAAALGAASVQLTDGGPVELISLARANILRNRHLFRAGSSVEARRLRWEEHSPLPRDADLIIASDVWYRHADGAANAALARTLRELLDQPPKPRAIVAHEHRSREAPFDATLPRWDADDELLEAFAAAAREHGLRLEGLWSRRPRCHVRGSFRSWDADVSIVEVCAIQTPPTGE